MLEHIFIGTFILTLLVGSALGVVVVAENGIVEVQENTLLPSSIKVISVGSNNNVLDDRNNARGILSEEEEFNYLRNLIEKLKKEVKTVPAVVIPGY